VRAWLLALAAAGCAHRADFRLPAACTGKTDPEACVGWAMDVAIVGAADLRSDDRAVEAYVEDVARRIAKVAGLRKVEVRLLDGDDPEASALMGDIIYVHRGVLVRLDDEAELAALLGHEITHLIARHTADLMHSDEDAAMSEDERLRRRDDDEALADERAVEWTAAAGYDPRAVLSMMRAIARLDDGREPPPDEGLDRDVPDDDHPPLSIRLARIARIVGGRHGGARNREAFLAAIDGMVVGGDPRRGRIENMTWIRARSGIAIDFPRDWKLTEQSPVTFSSPDGANVIVMPVGRAWVELVRPMLTEVSTRRAAGHDVTIGLTMPSDDAAHGAPDDPKVNINADARGTPTALVDEGDHATMITASGTRARARLAAAVAALRAVTPAERTASRPKRLHLVGAPRAGTVAEASKAACSDLNAGRALDDPARVVAAGDPIKCVE
jgi:predicted Zn-dependent protease